MKYSNVYPSYGGGKLVDSAKFQSDYVKDNVAKFEVEFAVTPLDTRLPTPTPQFIQTYGKLYIKLNNFSAFQETVSSVKIVQGLKWRVRIEKTSNNKLAASLLVDPSDFDETSMWSVVGVYKVLPLDNARDKMETPSNYDFV